MRVRLFVFAAIAIVATSCASIPPGSIKLPPIVIAPSVEPKPVEPVKPRATLAFEVLDDATGAPIPTAFATCDDGVPKQATEAGYIAVERDHGIYTCKFEADDYATITRRYQLVENRQFPVRLTSTKPKPEPAPAPDPVKPAPVPEPPPVVVVPTPAPLPPCVEIECVRQTAEKYPHLLAINTYESCLEFTQRVLERLPDYGHVGKTAGESQSVPHGFEPRDVRGSDGNLYRITGVSHDAIKHKVTGQVIDLLGNASANSDPDPKIHGPARIQWAVVPMEFNRVQNPYIPAAPVR